MKMFLKINQIYKKSEKNLSNEERQEIFGALLERSIDGKLSRNATREVSNQFSVPIVIVQRIWKRAKETAASGKVNVSHRRTWNCGRKRISIEPTQISHIPLCKRTTLRSMSMAIDVNLSILFRRKKEGLFRRHTNSIKPHLKEANMKGRLQFCISMLDKNSLPHEPKFVDMYNMVHIDEKWFYMTKKTDKYYLLPIEDDPHRTCQIIQEKWLREDRGKTIFIQQDNARTHVECGDQDFQEAASKTGFDIRLMCQPPNSPDLNILDLGFFSAIQSIQHKERPKTVEDLVRVVEESFEKYPTAKKEAKAVEEVGSGLEEAKVVEEVRAVEEVAPGLKKDVDEVGPCLEEACEVLRYIIVDANYDLGKQSVESSEDKETWYLFPL
ncbi:hypothetical protein ISN44_As07g011640 [Arabidopsis suecica]|uniref:DUF7769 domain-containing protein n=1 Tax=Arabidopsis suecica TaxID=45249 RepID=A0A8T2BR63_ARASU|nr:hypothetical protein ISN44_As07g011640 [Arabidopsis suecica]